MAFHNLVNLRAIDRFIFYQRIGHQMQLLEMAFEQIVCREMSCIDDAADFFIDQTRGIVRYMFVLRHRPAEKDLVFLLGIGLRTQGFGQAPFGRHIARNGGGARNII